MQSVRLLDQLRERIRYCHYSLRTEQAYVFWAQLFIRFPLNALNAVKTPLQNSIHAGLRPRQGEASLSMVKFYQPLSGGLKDAGGMRENPSQNRLAILPNATHYDILFSPGLVATTLPFLDAYPQ